MTQETRTHLINREGARCEGWVDEARREKGEYPNGSSTDDRRRIISQDPQPGGLERAPSLFMRWVLIKIL